MIVKAHPQLHLPCNRLKMYQQLSHGLLYPHRSFLYWVCSTNQSLNSPIFLDNNVKVVSVKTNGCLGSCSWEPQLVIMYSTYVCLYVHECACVCVSKQSAVIQSRTSSLFSCHHITLPHPALVIPIFLNAQNGDGGSYGSSEAHSPSPLLTIPLLKMCKTSRKCSFMKWHRQTPGI